MWVLWFSRAFLFERLLTLLHSLISLRTITAEKSLVCRRLYKIFHPFFSFLLVLLILVCEFFFVFSCSFIWVASDIHWYCDSLKAITIERSLVCERVYIFPSFQKKRDSFWCIVFVVSHCFRELVCFLHFESLLFFFFVGHKFSLYWFICCDALLIYWASHGNKMKMTTSTDKTMQLLN